MNWEKEKLPTFESETTQYEVLYEDGTTETVTAQYRGFDIQKGKLGFTEPVFAFWLTETDKNVIGWRKRE